MADTLVVIAERGSCWGDWAHAWRRPQHALAVLVPQSSGSHEELCNRVASQLDRLHPLDECQIVVAAGPAWNGPALCARAQLIRAILRRLAGRKRATRVLLDCGPVNGPAATGMKAIADAIRECAVGPTPELVMASGPSRAALRMR